MSGTDAMRAAKIVMELIRDDALVIPDDGRCWSWEASAEGRIAAALASQNPPQGCETALEEFCAAHPQPSIGDAWREAWRAALASVREPRCKPEGPYYQVWEEDGEYTGPGDNPSGTLEDPVPSCRVERQGEPICEAESPELALAIVRALNEREPRPAECPPHDFGQDEDPPATLPEMIGRTCPKCEISGGEVLGMMVKLRELEPGAGEGA